MEESIFELPLASFVEETASSRPTPGGGSVAALVGALSSALVQMVANLTIGKKKYLEVENEVKALLEQGTKLTTKLMHLAEEDMSHFNAFMAVLKLPKDSEAEKKIRREKMQQTLKEATLTPLSIAANALEVLQISEAIVKIGNKTVISDAGVAACLGEAAVQAALISVDINLPSIEDKEFVTQGKEKRKKIAIQAEKYKKQVLQIMAQRIA